MADLIELEDEISVNLIDENQEATPYSKDLLKEEDEFRLLNDLKQHPCLWNSSKVVYKDSVARANRANGKFHLEAKFIHAYTCTYIIYFKQVKGLGARES